MTQTNGAGTVDPPQASRDETNDMGPAPSSVFLDTDPSNWLASNRFGFVLADNFPVSPGHSLIISRRLIPTWFDATGDEQHGLTDLLTEIRTMMEDDAVRARIWPTMPGLPDGYNVGFNAGTAAGQTVPHLHIHLIPRFHGDVDNPRGGVRHVIPGRGDYQQPDN